MYSSENQNHQIYPKLIAFYLPQFHRIPENDLWWGEGFTEWTNTRKSLPLFENHYQPREPYQDYYYDLTDPNARHWQADIAKKHGIYGFCYYHYWFKGKLLLQYPLQEVLKTKEPDFPFCLSWANEPWTRRWDGSNRDILMAQEYGGPEDWKEHFNYLLPCFNDKRYIRINNKPLFIIYRSSIIPQLSEMLQYWDHLAKESQLEGIYFVDTHGYFNIVENSIFQASLQFEPLYTLRHDLVSHQNKSSTVSVKTAQGTSLRLANYDFFWEQIINRKVTDKKVFLGAFVDWDNSPRTGSNALIFSGATPEKFGEYLTKQLKRAKSNQCEFLFINAWNEWAEGTYLEPDKKYGYAYLEEVKKSLEKTSLYFVPHH